MVSVSGSRALSSQKRDAAIPLESECGQPARGRCGGRGGGSELLVPAAGVVHQLAACEELTALQHLLGLQAVILALVGDSDHLLGLTEGAELVRGVHAVLQLRHGHDPSHRGWRRSAPQTLSACPAPGRHQRPGPAGSPRCPRAEG